MAEEGKADLLTAIRRTRFPGKRARVAKYILDTHLEAAFLTAAEVASRVGVSEPTVIRFAMDLGYSGFTALQRALQDLIQQELTTVQRLRLQPRSLPGELPVIQSLWRDLRNIEETIESLDPDQASRVVDRLAEADRVLVVGLRMSAALAQYARLALKKSVPTVVAVTSGDGTFFEELVHTTPRSLVVGLGFPRYARVTVDYLEAARAHGLTVVAITDSHLSPLVPLADHVLLARSRAMSYVDSFAAPIALIGALATALSLRTGDPEQLEQLEQWWRKYRVFR